MTKNKWTHENKDHTLNIQLLKVVVKLKPDFFLLQRIDKKLRTLIKMSLFVSVMAQAVKSKDRPICDLPKEKGPCRGAFNRFYYNKESGECESFCYGGCQGNGNNFESKEECERQCKKA